MANLDAERFDIRIIERRLRDNKLTAAEIQAWLDALPDESHECQETETRITSHQSASAEEGT